MSIPSPAEKGQAILADEFNQLAAAIRSRSVSTGGQGLVQQRGTGTVILRKPTGLRPAPRRSSAGTFEHPFKVYDATDVSDAKVTVRFGQVNSVTPTIASVALNGTTPPEAVTHSLGHQQCGSITHNFWGL